MTADQPRRLPASFLQVGTSSFVEFVNSHDPSLLPSGMGGAGMPIPEASAPPHGTTIVAVTYNGGVLVAGDRRATMGSMIASRTIEKVFPADDTSIVGIAGTAGIAADLVRLLQLELSHYEKIEGTALSLEGKANRLATLIRSNLSLALRGLTVVPLFAGYDAGHSRGRVFSYDVTGGRYEEHDHHSVGSGALFARGSLKKRWRPGLSQDEAVMVAVEALIDAADDDAGTGGPDSARDIYPTVHIADAHGERGLEDDVIAAAVEEIGSRNGGRSARDSAQGGV